MTMDTQVQTIDWEMYNPDNIIYEVISTSKNNLPVVRAEDRTLFAPGVPLKMHLFTPPLVTNFPKLGPDVIGVTWGTGKDGMPQDPKQELDLCMKGASSYQHAFKKWADKMDDSLLSWMVANQRCLGKVNESREAIKAMQKRAFRKRVSVKTGQEYPDSWTVRAPKFNNDGTMNIIPILDKDNNPISFPIAGGPIVKFNDVVQASIRYDGVFIRSGMFGHAWTLVSIKNYGSIISTVEESKKYLQERPFPEVTDETSFPRLQMMY
jgi:hypothetical protein